MTSTSPAHAPLFVLGAPRSGTSLVYRLLCQDPTVGYLSNYVRRLPTHPRLALLNRVPRRFPTLQSYAWFDSEDNAYVYGGHRSLAARLIPQPVEGEPFFATLGVLPGRRGRVPLDLVGLRRRVALVLRSADASVFVSKRIAHNRRIGLLREAFPHARFVHVVRDGRAVAASLSSVDWWPSERLWWGEDRTPLEWESLGEDPWRLCARAWVHEVQSVEAGLADVPGDQVLELRYESLAVNLARGIRQVRDFAGIRDAPGWESRLPEDRPQGSLERWRATLGAATETVEDEQRPLLQRLGYLPARTP